MIKDFSRYHGAAIVELLESVDDNLAIRSLSNAGFYVINDSLPIYVKYSTSRKGPWVFNFALAHQVVENDLFEEFGECLTVFVCGKDGIAAILHCQLKQLLDEDFEDQESVIIKRRHNQMYQVRGKNGSLDKKVSRSSLPDAFLNFRQKCKLVLQ
ncbi:hypothetical protein [Marinobacter sp.]|uniref:hypothetical protein n=1 Tax=Marinobacter sp. TaxID=50741 RepID=UPI002355F26A|nr:hypothetical protein [Marinobacter sp.]